jgi:hypothetical protein
MSRPSNRFTAAWLAAFLLLPACAGDRTPAAPSNRPPGVPQNPIPIDGASIPDTCACVLYLSWEAGDPDPGDSLSFDVHLGTANPPPLAAENRPQRYFIPTLPDSGATYYWYIVAKDQAGAETTGPVWRFSITSGP